MLAGDEEGVPEGAGGEVVRTQKNFENGQDFLVFPYEHVVGWQGGRAGGRGLRGKRPSFSWKMLGCGAAVDGEPWTAWRRLMAQCGILCPGDIKWCCAGGLQGV